MLNIVFSLFFTELVFTFAELLTKPLLFMKSNHCKSLQIIANHCKSLQIIANHCKSLQP
jgi:hypothetical protein